MLCISSKTRCCTLPIDILVWLWYAAGKFVLMAESQWAELNIAFFCISNTQVMSTKVTLRDPTAIASRTMLLYGSAVHGSYFNQIIRFLVNGLVDCILCAKRKVSDGTAWKTCSISWLRCSLRLKLPGSSGISGLPSVLEAWKKEDHRRGKCPIEIRSLWFSSMMTQEILQWCQRIANISLYLTTFEERLIRRCCKVLWWSEVFSTEYLMHGTSWIKSHYGTARTNTYEKTLERAFTSTDQ